MHNALLAKQVYLWPCELIISNTTEMQSNFKFISLRKISFHWVSFKGFVLRILNKKFFTDGKILKKCKRRSCNLSRDTCYLGKPPWTNTDFFVDIVEKNSLKYIPMLWYKRWTPLPGKSLNVNKTWGKPEYTRQLKSWMWTWLNELLPRSGSHW